MKVTVNSIKTALLEYINDEYCSKVNDITKWLAPLFAGYLMPSIDSMVEDNKDMLMKACIMDEEGNLEITSVYEKIRPIAEKTGKIKQKIPVIGSVTLSVDDIDKLYKKIGEANYRI